MIRAGRLTYVQTMSDPADALGKKLVSIRNQKPAPHMDMKAM
ncbi:hypothetical protein ACF087_34620 [Streptomyces goshikiensis]